MNPSQISSMIEDNYNSHQFADIAMAFPTAAVDGRLLLLVALVFMIGFVIPAGAGLERLHHHPKQNESLNFLVIGDWGRKGEYNQSLVATEMGNVGEKLDIDFVVSTGDNIYDDGLKNVTDPAFVESFSDIYTAKSLQKPWYSVLGNHDYRGDALAQLSPVLRKIDPRWICKRSFIVEAGMADLFFVDTIPFVESYFTETDHTYDWRGVSPRETYISTLLKDLEEALRKSNATWKFVVGHHAIRSIGHHGDTPELIKYLDPLLKAYGVDMYINGHDHCLEHISSLDSEMEYITSGAGSKAWRGDVKEEGCEEIVRFWYDGQGFVSAEVTPTQALLLFYDVSSNILHQWTLHKHKPHHHSPGPTPPSHHQLPFIHSFILSI